MSESPSAAEREIANIRCLVAQQILVLEGCERQGTDRRAADALLRQLLRRDEDLRGRMARAGGTWFDDVRSD